MIYYFIFLFLNTTLFLQFKAVFILAIIILAAFNLAIFILTIL